jgi:hypothetical protein
MCAKHAIPKLNPLIPVTLVFLGFAIPDPAWSQQSPAQTESVAEAARSARERVASSRTHPKLITNVDLGPHDSVPITSAFHLPSGSTSAAETAGSPAATCDNAEAERLKMDLQAAEQQLAQLRNQVSYQPEIISDRDVDLESFQPGNSGLNISSPPLLDSQPPAPSRVGEVEFDERITSLRKALRIACDPPEAARIQMQIDDLEQQSDLLQRQFALDQEDYYSKPVTEAIGGNPQLDAEREKIQEWQSQVEQLKAQLASLNLPETPR